jgi:predicted dehydrogenase/nucleoside-diphosphate-sugar epimerase
MGHKSETGSRLRIGIVGCGGVARQHARYVKALPGAELVGVADVNTALAQSFAQQFGVEVTAKSLEALISNSKLDVVHITTPPAFHYSCAKAALERGVHVFLEKPVTFSATELSQLYERAASAKVLLCPDFINLFHPKMQQVLSRIESGELGRVVHVDCQLAIDLQASPELREARGLHWSYRLPGGVLRDYTSHLLYLALYFAGTVRDLHAVQHSHGSLPQGMADHLTVQIDGSQCSASLLLSCLPRPSRYQLKLFCERGLAEVDFEALTATVTPQSRLPRRIALVAAAFVSSGKLSSQSAGNVLNYVRGKLLPYQGLQVLIPRFYESVRQGTPPPVSRQLATAVVAAEEAIFSASQPALAESGLYFGSAQTQVSRPERVLVTGAAGYLGLRVVKALVENGYRVRALARPTSALDGLKELGVEVYLADVRCFDQVEAAMSGMDVVVHLAAGITGSSEFVVDTSVRGTENVAKAARLQRVGRLIYMSSISVYDFAGIPDGHNITENTPLEGNAETRGAYSLGKCRAEEVALAHLADNYPAWTILRPSLVVGGGRDLLNPVGAKLGGFLICMGKARKRLALIHVEDVAAAVVQVLQHDETRGRVYTLSQPETIYMRDYIRACVRPAFARKLFPIYVPYFAMRALALTANTLKKVTGFGPSLNRKRLLSVYRDAGVDSSLLFRHAQWQPAPALLDRLGGDTGKARSNAAEVVAPEPAVAERV